MTDAIAKAFGFGNTPELAANQEIEHVSYGEKLKSSCCGMGLGVVFFFGFLGIAGWNEYRNVANIQTIRAAREEYKSGSCSPIMSNLEGELVHLTCTINNLDVLGEDDPVLQGIPASERTGLSLKSEMEVYQWFEQTSTETKDDKVGGGTTKTTTYYYRRDWSTRSPEDNTTFHNQGQDCKTENGNKACYNWDPVDEPWWGQAGYKLGTSTLDKSENAKAGDYVLPSSVISRLGDLVELTPSCAGSSQNAIASTSSPTTAAPTSTNSNGRRDLQTGITLSCATGNGNNPSLQGDKLTWFKEDSDGKMVEYLTRAYTISKATTVSILAEQRGDSFVKWVSPYDDDYGLFLFEDGNLTATQMFDEEEAANKGLTWFLRFFSLLMVVVGLVLITAPLTEIPDIIPVIGPFLGDLIGKILWAVNCAFGCCCWSIVVGLCWVAYRPVVAIPLLIVSCALCAGGGYIVYLNEQKKKSPLGGKTASGEEAQDDDDEGQDVEIAVGSDPEKEVPETAPEE